MGPALIGVSKQALHKFTIAHLQRRYFNHWGNFYGLVSEDVNEGCLISWHFNGLVVIGDNSSQQDNLLRKEYLSQDSYGARLIQM